VAGIDPLFRRGWPVPPTEVAEDTVICDKGTTPKTTVRAACETSRLFFLSTFETFGEKAAGEVLAGHAGYLRISTGGSLRAP
jgi:hypothetical protein